MSKQKKAENNRGRPKFEITEDVIKKVEKYAAKGLYDYQIAEKLNICLTTLKVKKKQFSAFSTAIKKGRDNSDVKVINRLFQDACTPGNTAAQIFYLKNRCPDQWKDKQEMTATVDVELENTLNAAIERKRRLAKSRNETKS